MHKKIFGKMDESLFSKRIKRGSLVFLNNNRKRFDLVETRKAERKLGLASRFPRQFSSVLLRHSDFYLTIRIRARNFYHLIEVDEDEARGILSIGDSN